MRAFSFRYSEVLSNCSIFRIGYFLTPSFSSYSLQPKIRSPKLRKVQLILVDLHIKVDVNPKLFLFNSSIETPMERHTNVEEDKFKTCSILILD